MQKLKIPFDKEHGFSLRLGSKPFYFKQLQAEILLKGKVIGHMGILHPDVLSVKDWEWVYPVSVFEFNLEEVIPEFLKV